MERERFIKHLRKLEMAYSPKLTFTQEIVDLWYEMFADCNETGFEMAVNKCIKENEFAPNIATLMNIYKALENEQIEFRDFVKHQYTTIYSIWGEKYDSETFKELMNYVLRFPDKTRKTETVEFTHKAVSFSHDCDATGRINRPTIKEYIQGAR